MKLMFGVENVPYEKGTATVGDVAEILEAKYSIMEKFYEANQSQIVDFVEDSLRNGIDAILDGAPMTLDVFGDAKKEIPPLFQDFLNQEKMSGEGIPTKAALKGYHRNKKNVGRRASFVDEGLYRNNFEVWVEA